MPGLGVTADPAKYEEAIASLRKRVPVTREEFDQLAAAEREYAFTVANTTQANVVADVMEGIDRAIRDGTTLEDFKAEIGGLLDVTTDAHLETVFRTNVQGAYSAGRHAILTDPVVKEARPYWRFDAVHDSRTTDECAEADGTVLPADDPWWSTHTPPLNYNCRSQIVPLTPEEAEEEGIAKEAPSVDVGDGFGAAPSEEGGGDWSPDTRGYPEGIAEILRDRLGR